MNKYNFPENWPAPNEYMLELGRISVLWGSLEQSVNLAISKLAGYEAIYDYRAAILTAHSNFKQRVDIISTLCEQLEKEHPHLKSYKKVINKIESAQNGRNKFMHNGISVNEETGKVETARLTARGKLQTKIEEVNLSDLEKVTANIHEAMLALHGLITKAIYPPIWERNV